MPQNVIRHEGEHLYADQPRAAAGQRLSDAILRLRRSEQVQAGLAVRSSELSAVDLTALRYLVQGHRDGKNLGPRDLIVMLGTSSATVTNVVERLVSRGYVSRVQHPSDRRAHYLVPTDDAIGRVDEAFAAHHAAIVSVIDDLDGAEAETAAAVIMRIVDELDRVAARASR